MVAVDVHAADHRGMGLFTWLFGSGKRQMVFHEYWCDTSIKFDNAFTTPSGHKTKVVHVSVDITYGVEPAGLILYDVRLSAGTHYSRERRTNMAARRSGESWHAKSFHPAPALRQAVEADLSKPKSWLHGRLIRDWRQQFG